MDKDRLEKAIELDSAISFQKTIISDFEANKHIEARNLIPKLIDVHFSRDDEFFDILLEFIKKASKDRLKKLEQEFKEL